MPQAQGIANCVPQTPDQACTFMCALSFIESWMYSASMYTMNGQSGQNGVNLLGMYHGLYISPLVAQAAGRVPNGYQDFCCAYCCTPCHDPRGAGTPKTC